MASSRGNPDIGDIFRSVAVIGAIILALFLFGKLFTETPEQTVRSVDYGPTLSEAQADTDLELLAPDPLPEGWRATSVRFSPGTKGSQGSWHLGVLNEDEEYLGIEQTPLTTARAVERWAEGSEDAGSAKVAGQVWQVRSGPGDRIAYLSREDGRTTVVLGTVSQKQLESYISSLS